MTLSAPACRFDFLIGKWPGIPLPGSFFSANDRSTTDIIPREDAATTTHANEDSRASSVAGGSGSGPSRAKGKGKAKATAGKKRGRKARGDDDDWSDGGTGVAEADADGEQGQTGKRARANDTVGDAVRGELTCALERMHADFFRCPGLRCSARWRLAMVCGSRRIRSPLCELSNVWHLAHQADLDGLQTDPGLFEPNHATD